MQLSKTVLSEATELVAFTDSVAMTAESTATLIESNARITGVTVDIPDSGITMDFTTTAGTATIAGSYIEQFSNVISYNEPQVDNYTPHNAVTVTSWGAMPDNTAPNFSDVFDFIFNWTPPDLLSRTVTFTVNGLYDTDTVPPVAVPPDLPMPPVHTPDIAFTGTFTQVVRYDSDANIAFFKEYADAGSS